MDKKQIIKEVISLADSFENNGMITIANRVTDIAVRLAYDFNNPEKEEIVDESLAKDEITHWNDDEEDDVEDSSDKIDFTNLLKEFLVDDSLTKDFANRDDDYDEDDEDVEEELDDDSDYDEDEITSFDEENEGLEEESITEDDWNGMFHEFIVDGDITRSQIEDALSVLIHGKEKFAKYHGNSSALLKLASKHYENTNQVLTINQTVKLMNKMFGKDMDLLK